MRQTTKIKEICAKITADTCGTAMQRSVTVKVNCELDLKGAKILIAEIDNAREWVKTAYKGCDTCDQREGCPEVEGELENPSPSTPEAAELIRKARELARK